MVVPVMYQEAGTFIAVKPASIGQRRHNIRGFIHRPATKGGYVLVGPPAYVSRSGVTGRKLPKTFQQSYRFIYPQIKALTQALEFWMLSSSTLHFLHLPRPHAKIKQRQPARAVVKRRSPLAQEHEAGLALHFQASEVHHSRHPLYAIFAAPSRKIAPKTSAALGSLF
jgi:hypothetical protein